VRLVGYLKINYEVTYVAGKEAECDGNSQEQTTQCVFPWRYAEKYQQAKS
jgi:hypothetical protein